MTDFDDLAAQYLAAWNETDPTARRKLVEELFAPTARYVDPLVDASGADGIDAAIAGAQAQFPGWTFRRAGLVDGHHDQARFSWEFGPEGIDAPVAGFDVVQRDAAGRLTLVLGFLDRVPAS